jgi:hypothetical protein
MLLVLALFLSACAGDPPAEPAAEATAPEATAPAEATPAAAPVADAAAQAPPVEGAVPPPPQDATAPPPNAGAPSGGRPAPVGFPESTAARVRVSGTVEYEGAVKGALRVDVLRNKTKSEMPELAETLQLKAPGAFSLILPGDGGTVAVVAYVDTNENGPDASEPRAEPVQITLAGAPVEGVRLVVSDHAKAEKTLPDGSTVNPANDPSPTTYATPAPAPGAAAAPAK